MGDAPIPPIIGDAIGGISPHDGHGGGQQPQPTGISMTGMGAAQPAHPTGPYLCQQQSAVVAPRLNIEERTTLYIGGNLRGMGKDSR
jgi:hypothetical protein